MNPVAMHQEGPPLDEYKAEPSSPVTVDKDEPPPKKPNIRKRTKTGCLSMQSLPCPSDSSSSQWTVLLRLLYHQLAANVASNVMRENRSVTTASSRRDNAKATTHALSSRTHWVRSQEAPLGLYLTIIQTQPKLLSTHSFLRHIPKLRPPLKARCQSSRRSHRAWISATRVNLHTLAPILVSTEQTQRLVSGSRA